LRPNWAGIACVIGAVVLAKLLPGFWREGAADEPDSLTKR